MQWEGCRLDGHTLAPGHRDFPACCSPNGTAETTPRDGRASRCSLTLVPSTAHPSHVLSPWSSPIWC